MIAPCEEREEHMTCRVLLARFAAQALVRLYAPNTYVFATLFLQVPAAIDLPTCAAGGEQLLTC